MYSRSIVDRIKIQIEILCENISDFIRRHSLRTPLLVLSGVAVMMTLRNARSTIDAIKSMRGSPFGHKKSLYSPYGRSTGASNSYGGGRSYASPYAGSANSGSNSYGGQGSRLQQSFGQQSQYSAPSVNSGFGSNSGYNQQQAIPSYSSGNLRGAASAPGSSFGNTGVLQSATSGVIGGQTVPQGMLHSFSSMPYFSGQIETLSAPDSPNFVGQALASNGAGKVLVVDGGGSMNAIFDSSMAMSAQQNGWKGVIINGFVLDPQVLQTMPLGVQALGANPSRGLQMMGQKNVPISIGGVMFSPGSFVNVDMNGISVSSQPSQGGFGGNGITSNGGYNNGGYNAGLNTGAQNYGGGSNGIQTPSYGAPNTGLNSNSYGSNAATAGLTQGVNSYGSGLGGGANGNSYGSGLGRGAGTGAQPYGSRGRPARGKSSYSYNSYGKNRRRKKPAKRTLMAMLLFICAIVWVLLGD